MTKRTPAVLSTLLLATILVLGAVTAAAMAGAPAAAAGKYRLNPAHNIAAPPGAYSACHAHPLGSRCENVMIRGLNHAHAVMKQPRYHLPSRFRALSPRDQLLVLSNLDRGLYGRTPVRGLNPKLNHNAKIGANGDRDPSFVKRINGARVQGGGSNWAGGTAPINSPLYAYYSWMYDDGPGSNNLDCQHKGDPGCWGHRDNTLFKPARGDQVEMGAAGGKDTRGYYGWGELYESFSGKATIPCLPSVFGLSRHRVRSGGGTLVVHGAGFVQVRRVTVLGQTAHVVKRATDQLTIDVPRRSKGSGYVRVVTSAGTSDRTSASALSYGS